VRWSEDLQLASLADVDGALAKDDPLGFGELELGSDRVRPANCNQWAEKRNAGYEPITSLDVQSDGGALFQCAVLRMLKGARPARSSFVRELPKGGPALLGILPVVLSTAEATERAERRARLAKQGASFPALDPRAKIVAPPAPGVVRVAEGGGQSLVDIQTKAWGDFNGDGVDDLVLAVRNSMTRGSLSTARVLLVTRADATVALRVLEVVGGAP
jgi:hypothetical protein